MSATVIITFTAQPQKLASFKDILASVKDSLPGAPGCRGVQIFCRADDPCVFTLVESWDSVEAHQGHIEQVIASGTWDHIASHLACDPATGYFSAV